MLGFRFVFCSPVFRAAEAHGTITIELAVARASVALALSHVSSSLNTAALELNRQAEANVVQLQRNGRFFSAHLSTVMAWRNIAFVRFLKGDLNMAYELVTGQALAIIRRIRSGLKTEPLCLSLAGLCCHHRGEFVTGVRMLRAPLQVDEPVKSQILSMRLSLATIYATVGNLDALEHALDSVQQLQAHAPLPTLTLWLRVLTCRKSAGGGQRGAV